MGLIAQIAKPINRNFISVHMIYAIQKHGNTVLGVQGCANKNHLQHSQVQQELAALEAKILKR